MFITENHIKNSSDAAICTSPYFADFKAAVIDIETTGLSPSRDVIYLIGVLTGDAEGLKVTQFIASDYEDEISVLLSFFDFIKEFDIYLNYNGTSFDIPFVNKRCERLGIKHSLDSFRSIDYLRIFKASYLAHLLPNLKLKTVEPYAGIFREDKLSGKECIALYSAFVKKNDKTALKQLLLHNFEDLSAFPALNNLIEKIDMHTALAKTGFPVKNPACIFFVEEIKKASSTIKAVGIAAGCSYDIALYEDFYSLHAERKSNTFLLEVYSDAIFSGVSPNSRQINMLISEILSSASI